MTIQDVEQVVLELGRRLEGFGSVGCAEHIQGSIHA